MSLAFAWIVFPVVLAALSFGCGLLVEWASGLKLPGPLVVAVGFALLVVAANLATATGLTASLAVPLVIALAVAGAGLGLPRGVPRPDGWALTAAVGAFAVYAAPIVLSGAATFAGYITLDDTSTWLALTDRVMVNGRTLSGLDPSTYELVLKDYFDSGYPVGAFMPLGVGGVLTGEDIAWLFQPTIAFCGAILALSIYSLTSAHVSSRALRALAAFLGAQPALLFAYALWSGIKEVAAAAIIALVVALVAATIERWSSWRALLPAAIAVASLFAILSPAGAVWLITPALVAGGVLARSGIRAVLRSGIALAVLVCLLSMSSIAIALTFFRRASEDQITSNTEVANLGHPLDVLQLLGIWPVADFRNRPADLGITRVLIGVVILVAAFGLFVAWRRRTWEMPLYLATSLVGVLVVFGLEIVGLSSPWLNAKAMAQGAPAIVAAAVVGAACLVEAGRRVEGLVAVVLIAGGVLWSNTLAYGGAWLAPRSQLAELERIGERYAGQGPALMTDPHEYGVRHFLRRLDPEGASARRRRLVSLRTGGTLDTGGYADLDAFALDSVLVYRTLVLRRSPVGSRPPSSYRLASRGHWFEVWQRDDAASRIVDHVPFGSETNPAASPSCSEILAVAERARAAGGRLATVIRPAAVVSDLRASRHPSSWAPGYRPGSLVPVAAGSALIDIKLPAPARYGVWLQGSIRDRARVLVDGHEVGSARGTLNYDPLYIPFGDVELGAGRHEVEVRREETDVRPGAGGAPFPLGPLVLTATDAADAAVTVVEPADARSLCGRSLDWLEIIDP
jgi:hypothetical protein